jgi:hypothetical protein
MIETTDKDLIKLLKTQIRIRDDKITDIARENKVQSVINKENKKKYQGIILILSALLIVSLVIVIYQFFR